MGDAGGIRTSLRLHVRFHQNKIKNKISTLGEWASKTKYIRHIFEITEDRMYHQMCLYFVKLFLPPNLLNCIWCENLGENPCKTILAIVNTDKLTVYTNCIWKPHISEQQSIMCVILEAVLLYHIICHVLCLGSRNRLMWLAFHWHIYQCYNY